MSSLLPPQTEPVNPSVNDEATPVYPAQGLAGFVPEIVALVKLKPHPKNYRQHPADQVAEIAFSLTKYGFYRNIVVARDYTILAGHGVVLAAQLNRYTEAPVVRLDIEPDSPAALKLLASDNTLGRFAMDDDRALTELLREVREQDADALRGTGFDDAKLAALVMVTRPSSEIRNQSAASEWLGMPDYDAGDPLPGLNIKFPNTDAREEFCRRYSIEIMAMGKRVWSTQWPAETKLDARNVSFEVEGEPESEPEAELEDETGAEIPDPELEPTPEMASVVTDAAEGGRKWRKR